MLYDSDRNVWVMCTNMISMNSKSLFKKKASCYRNNQSCELITILLFFFTICDVHDQK